MYSIPKLRALGRTQSKLYEWDKHIHYICIIQVGTVNWLFIAKNEKSNKIKKLKKEFIEQAIKYHNIYHFVPEALPFYRDHSFTILHISSCVFNLPRHSIQVLRYTQSFDQNPHKSFYTVALIQQLLSLCCLYPKLLINILFL